MPSHGNTKACTLNWLTTDTSGTLAVRTLDEAVAELEKEMIIDAFKNTRGNVSTAATDLGTTVRKISYKAKAYGVNYKDYR